MFASEDRSARNRRTLIGGTNFLDLGYGRFLQPDPIGYDDGLNWYNYVHADPVNETDPTGTVDFYCATQRSRGSVTGTGIGQDVVVTAAADTTRCSNFDTPSPGTFLTPPAGGGSAPPTPGDIVVTARKLPSGPLKSGYVPAPPCKIPFRCGTGISIPPDEICAGAVDWKQVEFDAAAGAVGSSGWKFALRATRNAAVAMGVGTLVEPGGGTMAGLIGSLAKDMGIGGAFGFGKSVVSQACLGRQ